MKQVVLVPLIEHRTVYLRYKIPKRAAGWWRGGSNLGVCGANLLNAVSFQFTNKVWGKRRGTERCIRVQNNNNLSNKLGWLSR